MNIKKSFLLLAVLSMTLLVVIGAAAQDMGVTFISTQFNVVEEAERARTILGGSETAINFVTSEEGPLIDLLRAEGQSGTGVNDVVGALHGTYPTLAGEDLLFDLTDLLAEIDAETDVNDSFVELGRMGTEDYQYYIPWMQATYTMAAHVDALEHLPEGADLNALSWDDVAAWAQALQEATGAPQFGLPINGLINRFVQGYAYPSFTGGMVTQFDSEAAVDMLTFFRDEVWPYTNPQSINYAFMNEPLLSGEVMLTWDHVARLKPAFDAEPENFVAFPSPAGPAGRGYMPVIAGLGVPFTSPNADAANDAIRFLLAPETQAAVMRELGFYPVIEGIDVGELSEGVAAQYEAVQALISADDAIVALLPIGLGARGGEFNQIYRDVFVLTVVEGADVQTTVDEQSAILQTLLDETGAPCWSPDPASEGACQIE